MNGFGTLKRDVGWLAEMLLIVDVAQAKVVSEALNAKN